MEHALRGTQSSCIVRPRLVEMDQAGSQGAGCHCQHINNEFRVTGPPLAMELGLLC